MTNNEKPHGSQYPGSYLGTTYNKITNYASSHPQQWLVVDASVQRLFLVREGGLAGRWPVSTARAGLNNQEDSGGTPTGVHLIASKIGEGYPSGTIFESRKPTGETWNKHGNQETTFCGQDLILTRILILEGLEPGVNKGPGVDSRERYIYVHGTNQENLIGKPVSHGCVRMNNHHMIELFELVNEGDPLVIV